MQKGNVWIIVGIVVIILGAGLVTWNMNKNSKTSQPQDDLVEITDITMYDCKDNKNIHATYYLDKVDLRLSDGRTITLSKAISANYQRYVNEDETITFWDKIDTVNLIESDKETYVDCVETLLSSNTKLEMKVYDKVDEKTNSIWDKKVTINETYQDNKAAKGKWWANDAWDWIAWKQGGEWIVLVSMDGFDCNELKQIPEEYNEFFKNTIYDTSGNLICYDDK